MAAGAATIAGVAGGCFASRSPASWPTSWRAGAPRAAGVAGAARGRPPFGIEPYGLDALNTLRIEKGHVTGAEMNGNTSADDLGFGRMLKQQGDFIGRALSQRAGLNAPDRMQLVGVRPVNRARRLRNGAQLVAPTARSVESGLRDFLDTFDRA
jgi:glycine cleavage system aminomethyltransferase T